MNHLTKAGFFSTILKIEQLCGRKDTRVILTEVREVVTQSPRLMTLKDYIMSSPKLDTTQHSKTRDRVTSEAQVIEKDSVRQLNALVPADLHLRLKRYAVDHGKTITDVMRDLIETFLRSNSQGAVGKKKKKKMRGLKGA